MKSYNHKLQPDKFEQQIKQRLDSHQSPYDPAAWKNMEVLLDQQQDKQKVVGFWYENRYRWRAVAAACLLLMCVQLYEFLPLSTVPIAEQSSTQTTPNSGETKSTLAMPIISNNSSIGVVSATTVTSNTQQLATITTDQYNNNDNKTNITEKNNWNTTPNHAISTKTIANDQQFYSSNTNITPSFPTYPSSTTPPTLANNNHSSTTTISALKLPALALPPTTITRDRLPTLPTVSSQKIELRQLDISIASSNTLVSNSKTDMPIPKHKKRFWAGLQTAFAETFNNKNHRTTNNIPIGIAVAYNFAPQWELESGAYYNTQQQFTEDINRNAAQSHLEYTVKSLSTKQIEIPLLARYYMPANNPKWKPYVAVGTAFVWHLEQNYITDCNCPIAMEPVNTTSAEYEDSVNVTKQSIGITTERFRYDLGQIHLGTQYALNDKWLLQAEINYKTNFQPIYIRNAASRTLLVEPYRNNQTALQVGLARRF